jgi:hypothetical protein
MITQASDQHHFIRRARQIKARIPGLLLQWGLVPKFKRWRLAQDPITGMVVLFGVLDNKYIATHSTTPFADYFDPRVLNDLSRELQARVISSANDGLRYAFVLERGDIGESPAPDPIKPVSHSHVRMGLIQKKVGTRLPHSFVLVDDVTVTHQRLASFLKVNDALNAAHNAETLPLPDVLLMDQAEFNRKMADYENTRHRLL